MSETSSGNRNNSNKNTIATTPQPQSHNPNKTNHHPRHVSTASLVPVEAGSDEEKKEEEKPLPTKKAPQQEEPVVKAPIKKRRRGYPFNPSHSLEYGLRVVERSTDVVDANDKFVVVSVECRFCATFGRESNTTNDTSATSTTSPSRKPSKNIWHFTYPFRTTKYLQHLRGQHKEKWEHYQNLSSNESKRSFFCTPLVANEAAPTPTETRMTTATATTTSRGNHHVEAEKEVLEAQTQYALERRNNDLSDFDHPSFQRLVKAIAKASIIGAKYLFSSDAVEGFSLGRQT